MLVFENEAEDKTSFRDSFAKLMFVVFPGFLLSLLHFVLAVVSASLVVGIPFARIHLRLAKAWLHPTKVKGISELKEAKRDTKENRKEPFRRELLRKLLHNEDEEVLDILGQSYLTSFLTTGKFERSSMVLTARRLYQVGTIYEMNAGLPTLQQFKGKKVVSVDEITGTKYLSKEFVAALIGGIFFAIVSIILVVTGIVQQGRTGGMAAVIIGSISGAFAALGFLIAFFGKFKLFVVEYAGGAIATCCNWYPQEALEHFQASISALRDQRDAKVASKENDDSSEYSNADDPQSTSFTGSRASTPTNIVDILRDLKKLYDEGLITAKDYASRKDKALDCHLGRFAGQPSSKNHDG